MNTSESVVSPLYSGQKLCKLTNALVVGRSEWLDVIALEFRQPCVQVSSVLCSKGPWADQVQPDQKSLLHNEGMYS